MANYTVEVSEAADGAGASQAEPEWRTLLDKAPVPTGCTSVASQATPTASGSRATDRALNSASIVTDPVLIPVDDRDRGLLHLSRGWKRSARGERVGPHRGARQRGRRDRAHALPRHAGGADRTQARRRAGGCA